MKQLPKTLTLNWMKEYAESLGEDSNKILNDWCWKDFIQNAKESSIEDFRKKLLQEESTASYFFALRLFLNDGCSEEWLYEKVKKGNTAIQSSVVSFLRNSKKKLTLDWPLEEEIKVIGMADIAQPQL
jgi:hypothetical protein